MKSQRLKKEKTKSGLVRLFQVAGTKKWWLITSMLLSVMATLARFAPFVAVYLIITELALRARDPAAIDQNYVFNLAYFSLASVGIYGLLTYASYMLSHIAAFNLLYELRVGISEKLAQLPMGFFTKKSTGEIKKVMSEDVERIELFVAHHIPDLTSAIVFPLLMIAYLFYLDWRLALAALIPLPAALIVQAKMYASPVTRKIYRRYHDSLERMNATVIEYVRGIPVIKVFNQTIDALSRFREDVHGYRDVTKEITKEYAVIYPAFLTIISSSLLFIIPMSAFLLIKSPSYASLAPTVFLFLILGGGMFFPLFKLMWVGGLLRETGTGLERIDRILGQAELTEPASPGQPADNSLEFKEVTFGYDDSPVLSRISFRAAPNTITALVGPSGAGKTTIGMLTARFWDIDQGEILLGGINIKNIRTEELMNHVSFVFQDSFLFYDSIEKNIRMGNRHADRAEVIQAAKAAQCHKFVLKLPRGYDTLVGEGGTYLSGGEQQRITLARIFLKNTPLVVLDEATAYSDPESEGKILASLAQFIKDKTVIIIAHRLSTIAGADNIVVVDRGGIVEQGRHGELLSGGGLYSRMWATYANSRDWAIGIKD